MSTECRTCPKGTPNTVYLITFVLIWFSLFCDYFYITKIQHTVIMPDIVCCKNFKITKWLTHINLIDLYHCVKKLKYVTNKHQNEIYSLSMVAITNQNLKWFWTRQWVLHSNAWVSWVNNWVRKQYKRCLMKKINWTCNIHQ